LVPPWNSNTWLNVKRVALPSWADDFNYGFAVALDINTLVVGSEALTHQTLNPDPIP
jgi:hypothetical protein